MNDLEVFSILSAIALCACATGSPLQAQNRTPEQDRAALLALENEWLANEHNASVLERILASDFVHPFPTGDFVTKTQHIAFSSTHPPPANRKQHFDQMRVRVYGDVGIVNGVVVTTDEKGPSSPRRVFDRTGDEEVDRTVFTRRVCVARWPLAGGQRARERGEGSLKRSPSDSPGRFRG